MDSQRTPEKQVQVMCQLGILVRPAIHLTAVDRVGLALSQFADSLALRFPRECESTE